MPEEKSVNDFPLLMEDKHQAFVTSDLGVQIWKLLNLKKSQEKMKLACLWNAIPLEAIEFDIVAKHGLAYHDSLNGEAQSQFRKGTGVMVRVLCEDLGFVRRMNCKMSPYRELACNGDSIFTKGSKFIVKEVEHMLTYGNDMSVRPISKELHDEEDVEDSELEDEVLDGD